MNTFKKVMARPAKIQKKHQPLTQADYDNLFDACKNKNVKRLALLIPQLFQRSGFNYNVTNNDNETLLMTLFEIPEFCNTHSGIIKQLIEKMDEDGVSQKNNKKWTALMLAFRYSPEFCNNHSAIIKQLIEKMSEDRVSQKNTGGWTALKIAIEKSLTNVIPMLLAHSFIMVREQEYTLAIKKNNPVIVKCIREHIKDNRLVYEETDLPLYNKWLDDTNPLTQADYDNLFDACKNKNVNQLASLIPKLFQRPGFIYNVTNNDNETLLMSLLAIPEFCNQHSGVIKQLIEKMGEDGINQTDVENWTALMFAFRYAPEFCNNNSAIIKQLIDKMSANGINQKTHKGGTALMDAIDRELIQIIPMLLAHPFIMVREQEYTLAIKKNNPVIIKYIQAHILDNKFVYDAVDLSLYNKCLKDTNPLTQNDYDNLFDACKRKNVTWLTSLIPQLFQRPGFNYNVTNNYNETLLMRLFEIPEFCNQHSEVIKQLIEKMSQNGVNQKNKFGNTALMLAFGYAPEFYNNNSWVIEQLIKKMSENGVSQKNNNGWTALMHAFRYAPEFCNQQSHIIEQLIEKMSKDILNQTDIYNWTALMVAIEKNLTNIIPMLLAHPLIRVSQQDYDQAIRTKNPFIVKCIQDHITNNKDVYKIHDVTLYCKCLQDICNSIIDQKDPISAA